ncbi:MAG TPA: hypothetical protein VGK25_06075, partial [Ignavibacteria bacterium]
ILNYQIIDPAIILDKISHDYKKSFEQRVSNLKETFGELQSIYKSSSQKVEGPDKDIQLIRGFNKHRVAKYLELLKVAKSEILNMYSPRRAVSEEVHEDVKRILKSSGTIKSIYQLSDDKTNNDELVRICERFIKEGEEIKLANFKLSNSVIFDAETVFFNLSTDKNVPKHKQADLIIKNVDFVAQIRDLFFNYWEKAITIEEFKKKK